MTNFLSKSFSVAMGLNEKGRANYDRIFGKKRKRSGGKSAKPTAGMKAKAKADDARDRRTSEDRASWERGMNAPPAHPRRRPNQGPGLRSRGDSAFGCGGTRLAAVPDRAQHRERAHGLHRTR